MELALSFEKLNFQKLKELQGIAEDNKDAQMSDFVEGMMQEQVGKLCFFCSEQYKEAAVLSSNVKQHISGQACWYVHHGKLFLA